MPEYWLVDPQEPGLAIYACDASTGRYAKQEPDAEGFAYSPSYGKHVRYVRDDSPFGATLHIRS